jgi:hypothetical protein
MQAVALDLADERDQQHFVAEREEQVIIGGLLAARPGGP